MKNSIDEAANRAATSDLNLIRKPNAQQMRDGNYKMGHFRISGLSFTIENPAGSRRQPQWDPLKDHYGYVRGAIGADGDQVDCFLRPGTPADWRGSVYVVDQYHPADGSMGQPGSFDEHKCMVGYNTQADAEKAYLSNYQAGWKLGPVTAMDFDQFKTWLKSGTTNAPVGIARTQIGKFLKGDVGGHAFHGNQWTGGIAGESATAMRSMFSRIAEPDGGFTYSQATGEPAGGYALSIYPERSAAFDADKIRFADLARFAVQNHDLLSKSGNHIGAWHDPASHKVFLDVSMVTPDKGEAERLALAHDQIAYFDLNNFQSVTVNAHATSGGTVGKNHGQARTSLAALAGRQRGRSEVAGGAVGEDDRQTTDGSGSRRGTADLRLSLKALTKDFVAPASATSGIQPYAPSEKKKRKARRKPRQRLYGV